MGPTAKFRLIDVHSTTCKFSKSGVNSYNEASSFYYLKDQNRLIYINFRIKDKILVDLATSVGYATEPSLNAAGILNSRKLGEEHEYTNPQPTRTGQLFTFSPIVVSTNAAKTAISNRMAAILSTSSKKPLYCIYAKMKKSVLGDSAHFQKLIYYSQKKTNINARLLLTEGAPIVITQRNHSINIRHRTKPPSNWKGDHMSYHRH
jgi:hypothetical protein